MTVKTLSLGQAYTYTNTQLLHTVSKGHQTSATASSPTGLPGTHPLPTL